MAFYRFRPTICFSCVMFTENTFSFLQIVVLGKYKFKLTIDNQKFVLQLPKHFL